MALSKGPRIGPATGPTLKDALVSATAYWDAKGSSSRMMPIRASVGVAELGEHLEASKLGPAHGAQLLTALRKRSLAKSSVASYYAAFTRMLALSGVSTVLWPKAGPSPRRVREPLSVGDAAELGGWFGRSGYLETLHLLNALMWTGMRVEVEALSRDSWEADLDKNIIRITGKGGHERIVPVVSALHTAQWLVDARKVPYATHLDRWNRGVKALGISSRLPTPHAVRHLYATKAYERSGRNLRVVQELLGHADINTTARYIGVDMQELRSAVS